MAPLGVPFYLLIEDRGLVLSAIVVPFGSSRFMLCHSFHSGALPLSPLLHHQPAYSQWGGHCVRAQTPGSVHHWGLSLETSLCRPAVLAVTPEAQGEKWAVMGMDSGLEVLLAGLSLAQRGQTQVDHFTGFSPTPSSCLTCVQGLSPTMNGMGSPGLITLTCGERSSDPSRGCLAMIRGCSAFIYPTGSWAVPLGCPKDTSTLVCQELIPHFHSYFLLLRKVYPRAPRSFVLLEKRAQRTPR